MSCVVSFFFFFKQKTAYEMRISDWSSDVGSSDLHARRQFVAALQLFDAIFILRVDPLDRVVILRLDRFQCRLGIVLDHRQLPPVGAVEFDQHLFGDGIALLQALRHRTGRLTDQEVLEAGEGRAVRSEEHTSELQSLMRISYAVFCLKKKNKIKRQ